MNEEKLSKQITQAVQLVADYVRGFDIDPATLKPDDALWALDYMSKQRPDSKAATWFKKASKKQLASFVLAFCGAPVETVQHQPCLFAL